MTGLILLPTLNRPKLLARFFESYKATESTVPVWVMVDDEDFKKNQGEYMPIVQGLPNGCELKLTAKAISMGDKTRYVWPQIPQNVEWVGLLNDDHVCVTKEWDKKVEGLVDGTNMVSTNDGNWNFGIRVVGVTAFSKSLLDAANFPIFPRNLQHLYIDDLWKAIGESTGCWLETNKINIEHRHVFKNEMEQDETFKKVYDQASFQYDQKEFQHFMEQDFKDVCMRIAELRRSHSQKARFV